MHPSPWLQMASAASAGSRELILRAQVLHQRGQLNTIQVRWGQAARRIRLRVGFHELQETQSKALATCANAVPAVLSHEQCGSWTWLHLEARNETTLRACTQQLEHAVGQPASRRLRLQAANGNHETSKSEECDCAVVQGPCLDLNLAQTLEREGLPLVARPFDVLSKQLGDRTERALLARLAHWHRQGLLERLTLAPPLRRQVQRWRTWLLTDGPMPSVGPGMRLHRWRDEARGAQEGWLLSAVGDLEPLEHALPFIHRWEGLVTRLRPQAGLFTA